MCFSHDAVPPELPADLARPLIAGGAAARPLELESADGTRFSAALAETPEPAVTAVVILPDVRGLYPFYVKLAERFAHAGHHAITFDYFGRTAGLGPRDEDFDFSPHVRASTPEHVQADLAAALAALREETGAEEAVTVGFCFGGAQSFLAATHSDLGLAAAIGFYGALDGTRLGIPSPMGRASESHCPVVGLFGGADPGIPPEHVERFERGLEAAGVEHEIVSYEGAPHSFFDRAFEEHREACDDAWRRVLGFLDRLGARGAAR